MGLFGRPHVSMNSFVIALDESLCRDLPVLSTRIFFVLKSAVEHCAVTSTRKLAYGLFENVSIVNAQT